MFHGGPLSGNTVVANKYEDYQSCMIILFYLQIILVSILFSSFILEVTLIIHSGCVPANHCVHQRDIKLEMCKWLDL